MNAAFRWLMIVAPLPLLATPASAGTKLKVLVPAYFPVANVAAAEKEWGRVLSAHRVGASEVAVIANINSGPVYPTDWSPAGRAMYGRVFQQAASTGVPVFGYVSTNYGRRPVADVLADIRRWKSWGPAVKGIFLDEQPTSAAFVPQYQQYRQVVLQTFGVGGMVVANPGTWSPSATGDLTKYLTGPSGRSVADVMLIFENSGNAAPGFYGQYSPSVWKSFQPAGFLPDRFAFVCHSQPSLQFLQLASDDQVRWVYITDRTPGQNAYGGLPSYWDTAIQRIRSINATASGRVAGPQSIEAAYDRIGQLPVWLENAAVLKGAAIVE
ncbi:MAG: spherulation-specific family 4 protein [Planctomycetaceae bacterium]|nr:spherulation-specific family 4 protein [Planctomycetaceae bacterium]